VSAYARVIWEQPPVERAKLSHLPSLPSTITTAAHIRRFCVYCRRWVAPFIHLHTLHKSSGKLRLHIMTGTWEGLFVLPAVARPRSSPCFFVLLLQRHRRTASRLGGNLAQHSKVFCPSFRKRRLISWYTQRESSDYRSLTAVRFRYILSDIKKDLVIVLGGRIRHVVVNGMDHTTRATTSIVPLSATLLVTRLQM